MAQQLVCSSPSFSFSPTRAQLGLPSRYTGPASDPAQVALVLLPPQPSSRAARFTLPASPRGPAALPRRPISRSGPTRPHPTWTLSPLSSLCWMTSRSCSCTHRQVGQPCQFYPLPPVILDSDSRVLRPCPRHSRLLPCRARYARPPHIS